MNSISDIIEEITNDKVEYISFDGNCFQYKTKRFHNLITVEKKILITDIMWYVDKIAKDMNILFDTRVRGYAILINNFDFKNYQKTDKSETKIIDDVIFVFAVVKAIRTIFDLRNGFIEWEDIK